MEPNDSVDERESGGREEEVCCAWRAFLRLCRPRRPHASVAERIPVTSPVKKNIKVAGSGNCGHA